MPVSAQTVAIVKQVQPSIVTIKRAKTIGSGFIVGPNLVLTNRHVVSDSKEVEVYFTGEDKAVNGKVIKLDKENDIALIEVVTGDRKSLALATQSPDIGEDVLVFGTPYGFRGSVTRGIVSALDREISMENNVELKDLIQTDASTNPGNSGGPLVNSKGMVVGMMIAVYHEANNIAFAIPANALTRFIK